ncbi:DUF481 domain-containing protein [Sphingomonas bacterium]|uniref:DUF481 domain-containing protein n=1 Tax=Sphingomonas bacterium TaxID=1895847 RepID=UPI001575F698|nr:DUF481 domain-containing protein [Sphingomonas bacterium]
MRWLLPSLFPCLLAIAAPVVAAEPDPDPATIPPPIRAMLDAALSSGNDGEVATIVKYACAADPASGDAVQALAQRWQDERVAANQIRVREAGFLKLWTGKAEVGGFLTTGNSDTAGVTAALSATREGIDWRQKFHGQFDYQESLGIVTRNHWLAGYEPNYKFGPRGYVYGQLLYESDRFLGFHDRASGSAGIGYSVLKAPRLRLDLELGPAYRYTAYIDDTRRGSIAGRGSVDLKWQLVRGISLGEIASAYDERYSSTVSSATSVSAKLFGPLSANLSYTVQYESRPPTGSVATDTTSRAGLAYSF